jgi:hypothetical protein
MNENEVSGHGLLLVRIDKAGLRDPVQACHGN